MALKFRRGTTAQQSGSLAFGEPYVNTTLGTLLVGGASGDIVLSAVGTGSNLLINDITASGNLFVSGNATIGGTIQIGDNTSDTVNVIASLSSSLIPSLNNTFDLGNATHIWRDLYISTGSIKFVDNNGNVVGTLTGNANGDLVVTGQISGSSIAGLGNATLFSQSVDSRLDAVELFSSSLDSVFATDAQLSSVSGALATSISSSKAEYTSFSASNAITDNTQTTNITTAQNSADGAFASASAYSASAATSFSASIASQNTLSASIATTDGTQTTNITNLSSSAASRLTTLEGKVGQSLNTTDNVQFNTITANEFHITLVSSSVLFTSGSTKFGDTSDDIMQVTGSIKVTNDVSASTFTGLGNLTNYSTSVDSRIVTNTNSAAGAFASASAYSASAASALNTLSSSISTTDSASAASVTALSASIASTDATQTTNITTAQNSANGAFASASAYSASLASTINSNSSSAATSFSASIASQTALSASIASTDSTQTANITTNSNAAAGAFASASAYSASLASTIATNSGSAATSFSASLANVTAISGAIANNTITFNGSAVKLGGSATIKASTTNALTIGTGLSGTSFDGGTAVTIANTGVTSITGTSNQVNASASTGGVTLSLPQNIHSAATPTFAGLTINGAITATGDITAYYTSDRRHKNNIQPITNALAKVIKLNGVTWEWNDDVNEVTKQTPKTGLIAQEVQEVLPEVIKEREDGFLSLDYSKMNGLLVEAIKEQQQQIHNLTLEIEKLKKNNSL